MPPVLYVFLVEKAYAASPVPAIGPRQNGSNPYQPRNFNANDPSGFIKSLGGQALEVLALFAGAISVLLIIWYGIQYITAGGSADKVKAARAGIVNAIIGIIVITAAYAVIRFASSIGNFINQSTKQL